MVPFVSYVNAASDPNTFGTFVNPIINNIVTPIIGFLFLIAFIVFIFGIIKLIIKGDVSDESRNTMHWSVFGGLIGMVLMLSAWGIINLVANTVGQFK